MNQCSIALLCSAFELSTLHARSTSSQSCYCCIAAIAAKAVLLFTFVGLRRLIITWPSGSSTIPCRHITDNRNRKPLIRTCTTQRYATLCIIATLRIPPNGFPLFAELRCDGSLYAMLCDVALGCHQTILILKQHCVSDMRAHFP